MSMIESAEVNRDSESSSGPAKALRDTKRPFIVYASADERAEIERLAKAANRTNSDFLRSAALGAEIRGRAEADVVLALCDANAVLEWLGVLVGRLHLAHAGGRVDDESADVAQLRELLNRLPEARRRLAAAADALA